MNDDIYEAFASAA